MYTEIHCCLSFNKCTPRKSRWMEVSAKCANAFLPPSPSQKKNTTTIAVEVKKSQHKYVIGRKGNTLLESLDKTGVSVEIPPSDSALETVILRGEPDRLGQALTEVYAKVRRGRTTRLLLSVALFTCWRPP